MYSKNDLSEQNASLSPTILNILVLNHINLHQSSTHL